MKTKLLFLFLICTFMATGVKSNDSIYVMKSGVVMHKMALTDFDSISFYNKAIYYNTIDKVLAKQADFSLFYQALNETGLIDSIKPYHDKSYSFENYKHLVTTRKEDGQWFYHDIPKSKKYGFTVLMESNQTFAASGIKNLNDLKSFASLIYDQMYPEDAPVSNLKDRRNSLNRFISYHIINKRLSYEYFINRYDTDHMIKTHDLFEYIEPMCKNTLIEIKKDRTLGETNLINSINSEATVRITNRRDLVASNGVFHEIDKILTYNTQVHEYLSNKPLRFDFASFFSELTNNQMRGLLFEQNTNPIRYRDQTVNFFVPPGYLERFQSSSNTLVAYLPGYARFQNYMADELYVYSSNMQAFSFSLTTLPIPAGEYEVRIGLSTNSRRGVPMIRIDGVAGDRLRDWNLSSANHYIAYQLPNSSPLDDQGYENDKLMRNHGYMKAPASFKVAEAGWTTGINARYSSANLRVILGVFKFEETGNRLINIDMNTRSEFMLDYIEFVPISKLEDETIY